jgi:hypothetical protein
LVLPLVRTEEVLIALPHARERMSVAKSVRSTLVLSSVQSLRGRKLYDAYLTQLSAEARDVILTTVAGVWLPIPVGLAHYRACDALMLPLAEQVSIGHEVGNRIQGSLLGLLVRSAKVAGASPWTVMGYLDRLWDRVFGDGGGVGVVKLGPKEARVDLVGLALLGVPYFRNAYRGAFLAGLELFAAKVYVQEIVAARTETAVAFRVSWA